MSYLILPDFKKLIQVDNLNQIIGNDSTVLDQVKSAAVTELTSYLIQKYDCSREFTDTLPWARATTYKANNRVYLDADAYNPAATYSANALCLQAGNVYISIAGNAAHPFNASEWTLIGVQYSMYYVTLPYPEFYYNNVYAKGNQVFWKDKTYSCVVPTAVIGHDAALQIGQYPLPATNVAPDNPVNGVAYWGVGTAYSVTAGTLPTDATKFTAGDNRNQQLVNYCIDIALYTVHSRIAPRNIPELRIKRYDDVIKWLQNAAQGKTITAALLLKQPAQGGRIRFGGNTKLINSYALFPLFLMLTSCF